MITEFGEITNHALGRMRSLINKDWEVDKNGEIDEAGETILGRLKNLCIGEVKKDV